NPYFIEGGLLRYAVESSLTSAVLVTVDQIYHLASPASPPHYMYNPVKTIKTNTLGTINMLGLAKRVKATVLLASTSEVYGDPEVHPQPETYWGHELYMTFILFHVTCSFFQIYGNGSQTRSFQYVDDLVEGLISLMNSNCSSPINLGNPEEHSIANFAQIIRDLVGSSSEIVNQPSQEDDPQQRKPDISRAAKELNWRPKVTVFPSAFFFFVIFS
ncbi:NAD dependent epimerase/dehydratase family protein, partial [Ancylostoma duodenale]